MWRWRTPGFSRDDDAWVAIVRDEIVAYAWTFEGEIEVHVHPRHRGRGIGATLLDVSERRALEQAGRRTSGDLSLRQTISGRNVFAQKLLQGAGYVHSHHYARMSITLDEAPSAPQWPPSIVVRTYQTGVDEHRVHDLINAAWSDYAATGWEPESFERWMERTQGDDFDPSLWFLAESGAELAGVSLCLDYADMGWVAHLGVHPSLRRRGLGHALLLHSFGEYWRRGLATVQLTVSSRNSASARRLYERVGMKEVLRYESYVKHVSAAQAL